MFQEEIKGINPEDLIYLDESGIENSINRGYARAHRGKKIFGEITGNRKQRVSVIAGLEQKRLISPLEFEGHCDTELFNLWLERCLLPEVAPGKTLILDNASFHKSERTRELVKSKGCFLKFLPTYSPDLNPIENHWAILKARIKKHRKNNLSLTQSIALVFQKYD